ncbi:MAG: hypothetical protein JWO38_7456 [Gemmataceae bacterium]|nr:hypothetical protein [Gemmataceae bacterium]
MTEEEWLACTDPTPMMEFLLTEFMRRKVSERTSSVMKERKLRLFAVACCRRVWDLLPDHRSRKAVEVAERFADSEASREEVLAAKREAKKVERFMKRVTGIRFQTPKLAAVLSLSLSTTHPFLKYVAGNAACTTEGENKPAAEEQHCQCELLRDIFGNPYRPVTPNPCFLTSAVVSLATGIYADRAFDRLPILANALQGAGCEDQNILAHCRDDGLHVRGCRVVDQILGKR